MKKDTLSKTTNSLSRKEIIQWYNRQILFKKAFLQICNKHHLVKAAIVTAQEIRNLKHQKKICLAER